jgi:flagellin
MALSVATNTGALMAQAAASSVNKDMEISMERLSTGKRINGASDDAAGVAIASRLTAEIKGTNQAIRNAMDGQAMIDTAEGAHQEIVNLLQRMREIAVQAGNDSNDANDRNNLETEYNNLVDEIDRIATVTSWAGKALMNGSNSSSASGSGSGSASFTFQIGSGTNNADTVTASIGAMRANVLGVATTYADADTSASATGNSAKITVTSNNVTTTKLTLAASSGGASNHSVTVDGTAFSFQSAATNTTAASNAIGLAAAIDADSRLSATASGAVVKITKAATSTTSDLDTSAEAQTAITNIDAALQTVNTQRASLGSISNRLDSTVNNLTNITSNLQAGRGRIEDADFAAETTSLAKSQILQQASTAMLAQANASKQNVLSLLQG